MEYWLDVFDEKPLEAHRNEDGFIQLKDTGDPLIDKWEEAIARGEEPDLTEAFTPEAWDALNRLRQKSSKMSMATRGEIMKETLGSDVGKPVAGSRKLKVFGEGTD